MDGLLMQVFADVEYASKTTDRRSVSGGLIMCGGACVQWFSRTQKCVTLANNVLCLKYWPGGNDFF